MRFGAPQRIGNAHGSSWIVNDVDHGADSHILRVGY